jgi:iron-sulfur cluster insertion protein
MATFSISQKAAARINEVNHENLKSDLLKITVNSGGCNGMQYKFEFTNDLVAEEFSLFRLQTARVAIDEVSLPFLNGAMLDFEEDLGQSAFIIKNPNARTACGCGTSFSVD